MAQPVAQEDPIEIHQHLLDETGAAYLARDFDRFARCFELPLTIGSFDGDRQVGTEAELRAVFDGIVTYMARHRFSDIVRRSILAEWRGANVISATHETRWLRADHVSRAPYPAHSVLHRGADGHWRVADSSYAISGIPAFSPLPRQVPAGEPRK